MTTTTTPARGRSRRFWLGAACTGLVGAFIAGCLGRDGHHSWHRSHGFHDVSTPQEAQARAQEAMKWVLREVDATEDQQQRIRAIVDESVTQLYPLREQHRRHHDELLAALDRPQVERAEVERLRKAELEIADAASNWLVDAALDAFEVLSPAQRAELMEHMREHHM